MMKETDDVCEVYYVARLNKIDKCTWQAGRILWNEKEVEKELERLDLWCDSYDKDPEWVSTVLSVRAPRKVLELLEPYFR